MRGAEAKLSETTIIGKQAVVKERIAKTYRLVELDDKLRRERTRSEAKLLHRAKLAGVACPTVYGVWDFEIVMSRIEGKRPEMDEKECGEAGELLARLHGADIIHGDYTPANLIKGTVDGKERMHVIDFGLGFVSMDIEDKATDVFTMLQALRGDANDGKDKRRKTAFIDAYRKNFQKSKTVLKRVGDIEKRVRYAF